jgi:predicted fused transcriptional regulator/phosphomethylpyrimidine kinase
VIRSKSQVEEAVRTMSSTYNNRKAIPSVHMNYDVSEHEHVKPVKVMKVTKQWHHARGACLRP